MSKIRILYVANEIEPFLSTNPISKYLEDLPSVMQERGADVRVLVPRFGNINERKNRLHEVVRLSGITIPVGDDDKPLTIKVASIPTSRLQVYFIENEDYFQRKSVFTDSDGNFYDDNDERAIFFCKGVIETVKKLGWAPDVVHCCDWFSALVPLYLKTTYKNDPMFKDSRIVYTAFDTNFDHKFALDGLYDKVKLTDVEDAMLSPMDSADYAAFVKMGMKYADVVVQSEENLAQNQKDIFDVATNQDFQFIAKDEDFKTNHFKLYSSMVD
jgi:starch synthase